MERQLLHQTRHFQAKHLGSGIRIRHRDLFEPKENSDHSWSISGTFSSSDPSELSSLYNSSQTIPPLVDIALSHDPSRSQQDPPPILPTENAFPNNAFYATTFLAPFVIILFCALCFRCGGGPPGEEHHRGWMFREQARRIWELEEKKAKRFEATPEERLASIRDGVCTFKVVRKDPCTARCELGEAETELSRGDEDDSETTSIPAMGIETKMSTDTIDTLPLKFDKESDSVEYFERSSAEQFYDSEEEEDVCHVCLDGFETGDTVMFARNLSCTHVFHKECLLPWLLERRENECPSCRAILVKDGDAKMENENNRDGHNCICSENGRSGDGFVDLERGIPTKDCLQNAKYDIVKGRIVSTMIHSSENKHEVDTPQDRTFLREATKKDSNATAAASMCILNRGRRLFPRPRARSLASINESPLSCQDLRLLEKCDLSIPPPFHRVSKSFPVDRCRTIQATRYGDVAMRSRRSSYLQGYQNDSWNQCLELLPSDIDDRFSDMHSEFCDSSSCDEDDDSDEDDAIYRMVHNHKIRGDAPTPDAFSAHPSNVSSIFARAKR
jgi:hypothetical protein